MSHCAIVPPHLLDALAASGDPELAARARHVRAVDAELRRARRTRGALPDEGATPAAPGVGGARSVHDAKGEQQLPGDLVRGEGDPATGDAAVDEAYDGLGATRDFWRTVYGRDSLDGRGMGLVGTVHYGQQYDNAFWDGSQMVFGDGDGVIFTRFTASLDVIGHELAHGVTELTSGLVYQGQSGALNEHVSDVFGVLVKQHHLGQDADAADWLVGAELLAPGVQGRALRSMSEPGTAYDDPRMGKDPQPGHMDDFVVTSADNGGVHINSGIPNRAFYLLATALGGPAWERAGQIWVDTILGDIRADCDFARFAALTVVAARARYDDEVAAQVLAAWQGVGVVPAEGESPQGSSDASAGEPQPAPTHTTELTLTRSGGVAGLVRRRTVTLGELPDDDRTALASLLTDPELAAYAAAEPSRPDAFCYGLSCDQPPLDVQVPEPVLPPPTRALLDRTIAAGGPQAEPPAEPGAGQS
ncbi:protealysin inhibitor emfourin [Janibacter melonis]|uniref:protealysin inhibitor emfourin n=1 Tax=Janibacter melonis TaxID=262209 RepID=UPI001749D70C|nr:protealysin inhibitor emfourin [Janibacter melonis]